MPENPSEGHEHTRYHGHNEHSEQQRSDRAEHATEALQSFVAPQAAPLYHASLLGSAKLDGRGNGPARVALLRQMQQTYGNRAVQRFLHKSNGIANPSHETGVICDVQRVSRQRAVSQEAETALQATHVPHTKHEANQSISVSSNQLHLQRYIKGDKNGAIRLKIEDSVTYKTYNNYEKKKVKGWMNSTTYGIRVKGIRDLDRLLKAEKAKFKSDYLKTWKLKALRAELDNKSLSTQQLDRINNEILRRERITKPKPMGLVIRDPSRTQPKLGTFVPNSGNLKKRASRWGTEGKDWKKIGNSKGKSAATEELNTEMRTVPNMTWTDTGGTEQVLCPSCGHALAQNQYHTDHQIAFETLKRKALELADYINLSPAHEMEVKKQYAKFHDYFTKDTKNNWVPTNMMISDYSNDMSNLFRICGSCNSMIGGKGTTSITDWFENAPLFGTDFTAWATSKHGAVTPEFFGNPAFGQGWGLAARKWVLKIIGQFTDLLKAQEERHLIRLEKLRSSTTKLTEAKKEHKKTTPMNPTANKKLKRATGEYQKQRLSIKTALKVEEILSEKLKMSEYEAGSDEETLAEDFANVVSERFEQREKKKRKRKRRYSEHLEDRMKDPNKAPTKKSKTTHLAEVDAMARVQTLKLMALHEVAGVGYAGTQLEGTTTHDAMIRDQAKIEYQKQLADLITAAKEAGGKEPPGLIPMAPSIVGMTTEIQAKLQQMINAAYHESLLANFLK